MALDRRIGVLRSMGVDEETAEERRHCSAVPHVARGVGHADGGDGLAGDTTGDAEVHAEVCPGECVVSAVDASGHCWR